MMATTVKSKEIAEIIIPVLGPTDEAFTLVLLGST